jgi:catechol 2,3-dioxygenase-like lactoylglutathione lyase family enzyme
MKLIQRMAPVWLILALLFPAPALAERQAGEPAVSAVGPVGMTVSNMDRAIDFYSRILSFDKVSDSEVWGSEYEQLQGIFGLRIRVVQMQLGAETLELTEYLTPRGRPIPVDSRSNDRWFQHVAIITNDMDRAYSWLRQNSVQHASTGPQLLPAWNPNAGGIQAFYFKDPDDHVLEVLQFPPDKGDPRWQLPSDRLFLGIDHTAIVIGNTETSLHFYSDILGFRVAGTSENYGDEQEHLNNVEGAHLRITSLRTAAGPAIEFLEYLSPIDGRPYPADARPNDLWHWQTTLFSDDASAAGERVLGKPASFISPGLISIPTSALGFRRGELLRDPDGHALRLVER